MGDLLDTRNVVHKKHEEHRDGPKDIDGSNACGFHSAKINKFDMHKDTSFWHISWAFMLNFRHKRIESCIDGGELEITNKKREDAYINILPFFNSNEMKLFDSKSSHFPLTLLCNIIRVTQQNTIFTRFQAINHNQIRRLAIFLGIKINVVQ